MLKVLLQLLGMKDVVEDCGLWHLNLDFLPEISTNQEGEKEKEEKSNQELKVIT